MSQTISSHEPATGVPIWEGEAGDVTTEVARAADAWPHWAALPLTNRIETMRRFVNAIRGAEDALTDLIARETGKPLWEAQHEVAEIIASVDIAVSAYSERTSQRRMEGAMGARQAIRHKPHGVLAVITPHCQPAQIPGSHILPALIAGNAVVFKPAVQGIATAQMLVSLYRQAGVPEDVLRLLPGGPEEGMALALHSDVRGVLFTGSVRAGLAINHALVSQPEKIVALALGGNNPIVVWNPPDLHTAAILVIQSAFGASGQHCTSARRLIVSEDCARDLLLEIRKLCDRLIIDHPHAQPAPFMGPVVDNHTADGLTESFLYLMAKGARPIRHPSRPHGERPFLSPAIIDVTDAQERPDIELFGPMLQVVRVADFETGIREANASRYGLCASLIGGTPEQYGLFWSAVRAGNIHWNRATNSMVRSAPFGGTGLSGNHRPGGTYSADNCAYPVSSIETEQIRAVIGIGLLPTDTSHMGD